MPNRIESLSERTIQLIVTAAQRGWSPADLLHVFGASYHPILYRAAPRIPARIASPALRKEWLMLAPPEKMYIAAEDLANLVLPLSHLPLLKDTELLTGEAGTLPKANSCADSLAEKMRHKIASLLRKAESTPFEDEASAFIAKAQRLQQKYRIEDLCSDCSTEFAAKRIHISAPYIKHQFSLLNSVAMTNGCASLLLHDKGIACIIGAANDTEHVAALFDSLNRQCDWFMRNGDNGDASRQPGGTAAYRRSFRLSYAARIHELLETANSEGAAEAAHDAAATGDEEHAHQLVTRALPALYSRQEQAEATRDRLFPHLRTMSLSLSSWAGVHDGLAAAEKSHLSSDSAGLEGRKQLTG